MPMQRERYPEDWETISLAVKQAADWKCESCGKECRRPGEPHTTHKETLTVAHLNHTPECREPEMLVALCAPCHLAYDAPRKRLQKIVRKRLKRLERQLRLLWTN